MVKYLFVIFYLCVVMFLNLRHHTRKRRDMWSQKARRGDGRSGNARYMNAN